MWAGMQQNQPKKQQSVSIYLSIYLSQSFHIYLSIYPSISLFLSLSLSLSIYIYIYICIYISTSIFIYVNAVGWGCKKHQLYFCGRSHVSECPAYNIKHSDGKAPTLERWEMWSTPSLLLLPGPLWPGVVSPDKVLWVK